MNNNLYVLFNRNTPDDTARAAFVKMYHVEPKKLIRTGGGLLVGPIPTAASAPKEN